MTRRRSAPPCGGAQSFDNGRSLFHHVLSVLGLGAQVICARPCNGAKRFHIGRLWPSLGLCFVWFVGRVVSCCSVLLCCLLVLFCFVFVVFVALVLFCWFCFGSLCLFFVFLFFVFLVLRGFVSVWLLGLGCGLCVGHCCVAPACRGATVIVSPSAAGLGA